jgi:hypothetical protein
VAHNIEKDAKAFAKNSEKEVKYLDSIGKESIQSWIYRFHLQ